MRRKKNGIWLLGKIIIKFNIFFVFFFYKSKEYSLNHIYRLIVTTKNREKMFEVVHCTALTSFEPTAVSWFDE